MSDQEMEARIHELAANNGQTYDAMRASLETGDMIESVRGEQLTRKVFEFVEKNAKITMVQNDSAGGNDA